MGPLIGGPWWKALAEEAVARACAKIRRKSGSLRALPKAHPAGMHSYQSVRVLSVPGHIHMA